MASPPSTESRQDDKSSQLTLVIFMYMFRASCGDALRLCSFAEYFDLIYHVLFMEQLCSMAQLHQTISAAEHHPAQSHQLCQGLAGAAYTAMFHLMLPHHIDHEFDDEAALRLPEDMFIIQQHD